mmetsp:Transcript_1664/g.1946  ORF Transcript_1664/g.1946 Transcript_1664/m.1946 type:complete len:82 (+) Transcript_1664:548-793(+)
MMGDVARDFPQQQQQTTTRIVVVIIFSRHDSVPFAVFEGKKHHHFEALVPSSLPSPVSARTRQEASPSTSSSTTAILDNTE